MLVYKNTVYRTASVAEKEVEKLLLALLPTSPFANKVYAVGGYVRDELMGIQSKDLDLVIELPNGAEKLANYLHELFPTETSTPRQIGAGYPIWHLVFKTDIDYNNSVFVTETAELDFADTQKEAFPDPESRQRITQYGTLAEDTERRDFTVNMLLKDMTTGEVVDPTGIGVQDIKDGVLRLHPEIDPDRPFTDDPLRMLRLVRFSAKYDWKADEATIAAVQRNAKRIEIVSGERVQGELVKIMKMGKLAAAIEFMRETGLLKYVLPEIEALIGVEQDKQHHAEGDVYRHTLNVLQKAQPTIEAQLAALLHDAGKRSTQEFVGERIKFLGHEKVSGEIAEAMLRRLKFDLPTIQRVRKLVENHMRAHSSAEWGGAAIRKFIREIGDDLEILLHLTEIDALSSLGPNMQAKENPIPGLRERIKQTQEIPVATKPVLNGKEIMDIFGIQAGKGGGGAEVGKAQRWLQEKTDELAAQGETITAEKAKELLLTQYKTGSVRLIYKNKTYRLALFSRINPNRIYNGLVISDDFKGRESNLKIHWEFDEHNFLNSTTEIDGGKFHPETFLWQPMTGEFVFGPSWLSHNELIHIYGEQRYGYDDWLRGWVSDRARKQITLHPWTPLGAYDMSKEDAENLCRAGQIALKEILERRAPGWQIELENCS